MADQALVGALLAHLGGPSMRVAGGKSALPAGDRVGILLNNITPSMAARLARQASRQIGRRSVSASLPNRSRPPSTAEALGQCQAAAKARSAARPVLQVVDRVELRARFDHRARPLESSEAAPACRAFRPDTAEAAQPPKPAAAPLGWPWHQPPPTPAPAQPPADPKAGPPFVGTLIDLFA